MKKVANKYLIAFIAILGGILISANMNKVPASMSLLLNDLGITTATAGLLVSSVNLTGLILGIPAGGIMAKVGSKKMGIFALACGCLGCFLGYLSNSLAILLFSRFIEGFGYALIAIVVPSIIADWFEEDKRGLPMAIWSCWIGLGLLLALRLSNVFTEESVFSSWHNLWLVVAILLAVVTVLFAIFIPNTHTNNAAVKSEKVPFKAYLNPAAWCLSLIMFAFGSAVLTLTTFSTTYCQDVLGTTLIQANNYTSFLTFGMIGGGILVGVLLNYCHRYNFLLILSMILTTAAAALMFAYSTSWAVAYMLIGGIVLSMTPAIIFTIAPLAAPTPQTVGVVMGILAIGQNLPGFATTIIGKIISIGYPAATLFIVAICIIGVVLSLVYAKSLAPKK